MVKASDKDGRMSEDAQPIEYTAACSLRTKEVSREEYEERRQHQPDGWYKHKARRKDLPVRASPQ